MINDNDGSTDGRDAEHKKILRAEDIAQIVAEHRRLKAERDAEELKRFDDGAKAFEYRKRKAQYLERRRKEITCLELRIQGLSYDEIERQTGFDAEIIKRAAMCAKDHYLRQWEFQARRRISARLAQQALPLLRIAATALEEFQTFPERIEYGNLAWNAIMLGHAILDPPQPDSPYHRGDEAGILGGEEIEPIRICLEHLDRLYYGNDAHHRADVRRLKAKLERLENKHRLERREAAHNKDVDEADKDSE